MPDCNDPAAWEEFQRARITIRRAQSLDRISAKAAQYLVDLDDPGSLESVKARAAAWTKKERDRRERKANLEWAREAVNSERRWERTQAEAQLARLEADPSAVF